jgi:hypothetical protein
VDQADGYEAAVSLMIAASDLARRNRDELLLLKFRPEVIITHPLRDMHPKHRGLAQTVLTALPQVVIATATPTGSTPPTPTTTSPPTARCPH